MRSLRCLSHITILQIVTEDKVCAQDKNCGLEPKSQDQQHY